MAVVWSYPVLVEYIYGLGIKPAKVPAETMLLPNSEFCPNATKHRTCRPEFRPQSDNTPSTPIEILPMTEVERQTLIHALEITDNNVTQAAQALGINRAILYRKLKKYAIVKD